MRIFQARKFMATLAIMSVLCCIGWLIPSIAAADDSDTPVNFPDANLQKALLDKGVDANGDGIITRGELAALGDPLHMATGKDSLDLQRSGISNLSGLEYAVNLTYLGLDYNNLSDLGPLANLSHLQVLDLSFNNGNLDLSALSQLPRLRLVSLEGDGIQDIQALGAVGSLQIVHLAGNQIRDIGPLANLGRLTILGLFNNQVDDLSPLANLTNLTDLDLEANRITDVSPLQNLHNLHRLSLMNNAIQDASPLARLTGLTDLRLDGNQISSAQAFSNLTGLSDLGLNDNQISDVSPLRTLTHLQKLYLPGNHISDIGPLASLTQLQELSLSNNHIRDIAPLSNLTSLRTLSLADNDISDIHPLSQLTNLSELALKDNQIGDVSPLANLANLKRLTLSNNPVTDLSPLSRLDRLIDVDVDDSFARSHAPVVTGVQENEAYHTDRTITFDIGEATLNNQPFASGTTVSAEGDYDLLVIDNQTGLATRVFFQIDKTPPVITGVTDGGVYQDEGKEIIFNEGTGTLNGYPIRSYQLVSRPGDYDVVVTDDAGNRSELHFTIIAVPNDPNLTDDGMPSSDIEAGPNLNGTIPPGDLTVPGDVEPGNSQDPETIPDGKGTTTDEPENSALNPAGNTTTASRVSIDDLHGVSNWAKPTIETAIRHGLVEPVQDLTFTDRITREQFAEIAVKLYEVVAGERLPVPDDNPFVDTKNQELVKAYQAGIVSGTSDDTFSPDALITREQLAVMLKRVFDHAHYIITTGEPKAFADRRTFSPYAVKAIDFMSSVDVVQGVSADKFAPKQNATVEEAVIMANRLYELLVGP